MTDLADLLKILPSLGAVSADSRNLNAGDVFVCTKGARFDGHAFIPQAVKAGIGAIIVSEDIKPEDLKLIQQNGIFLYKIQKDGDLEIILRAKYPKQPRVFAVTGTNGKSSTVHFCLQITGQLNVKAVSIGTLGVLFNYSSKLSYPSGLTTPDNIILRRILHEVCLEGAEYVFLEASSIGLAQGRLDGIDIEVGAFTNFTQDHMDYHKTMEEYLTQKLKLFSKTKIALVHSSLYKIIGRIGCEVIGYGFDGGDLVIKKPIAFDNKLVLDFKYQNMSYVSQTNLMADFQLENLVCALLGLVCLGFNLQEMVVKIPKIYGANGRLEPVANPKNFRIFVDYAHTPDALEQSIANIQKMPHKRLITLFGCGGDRDITKRPIMGKIAVENSDFVIITDDNPRNENAEKIRQDIISGIGKNFTNYCQVGDRREAIRYALSILKQDDILLLAGKGHETYQIIGDKIYHFDDKQVVLDFICG